MAIGMMVDGLLSVVEPRGRVMIDARWTMEIFWQGGGDKKTTADDRPAVRLLFKGGRRLVPRRKSNYLFKTRAMVAGYQGSFDGSRSRLFDPNTEESLLVGVHRVCFND